MSAASVSGSYYVCCEKKPISFSTCLFVHCRVLCDNRRHKIKVCLKADYIKTSRVAKQACMLSWPEFCRKWTLIAWRPKQWKPARKITSGCTFMRSLPTPEQHGHNFIQSKVRNRLQFWPYKADQVLSMHVKYTRFVNVFIQFNFSRSVFNAAEIPGFMWA